MTRKDYQSAAECIRHEIEWCKRMQRNATSERNATNAAHRHAGAHAVALNLAAMYASKNPRFDRERFLRACGVDA